MPRNTVDRFFVPSNFLECVSDSLERVNFKENLKIVVYQERKTPKR